MWQLDVRCDGRGRQVKMPLDSGRRRRRRCVADVDACSWRGRRAAVDACDEHRNDGRRRDERVLRLGVVENVVVPFLVAQHCRVDAIRRRAAAHRAIARIPNLIVAGGVYTRQAAMRLDVLGDAHVERMRRRRGGVIAVSRIVADRDRHDCEARELQGSTRVLQHD